MSKFGHSLDVSSGLGKSGKDGTNVSSLLHGDDTELILHVDPHKEGLLIVVEDTSALGPVAVDIAGFEESIALFEEEMVSNELLSLSFSQGV